MEDKLALAIFDMLFVFGSGSMRGTLDQMPLKPVDE